MVNEKEQNEYPKHIAIIMDGNGRWAKQRGLPRSKGHRSGVDAVRRTVEACAELGIEVLTLYTFSTENWRRPSSEISWLMFLIKKFLPKEIRKMNSNNIRFLTIGRIEMFPIDVQEVIAKAIKKTEKNNGLKLCLAMNYGSREEMVTATRKIIADIQNGKLVVDQIDKTVFGHQLYTAEFPDPDIVIRTSGEMRLSNFLLWQSAYAKIRITPVLWPDFDKKDLVEAIEDWRSEKVADENR